MIEEVTIRQVASFNDVGVQLDGLQKVNFIYGANATGKTTISNLLCTPTDANFANCTVKWSHNQPLQVLVYNKHFRESNFSQSSKLQGIFTLGKATKEDIELIEQKKIDLTSLKDETNKQGETLRNQKEQITQKESEFKEVCWKFYKKYETGFKEAFVGYIKKESFKNKLLSESNSNASALLTIEKIKEQAKTIFGDAPKDLPFLKTISFDRLAQIENDEIWKKKVVGKSDVDIAKLIQNLNMNDWVNQGREYLQEDETCPFCQQQTITVEFLKQLEDYFDESFTESIQLIKALDNEYNTLSSNLINELSQLESNEQANLSTKLDVNKFTSYLKTLASQFISNRELTKNKTKEPSRTVELISTNEQLKNIADLIADSNEEIGKHNAIVANFQNERNRLIHSIWRFVAEEAKSEISKYATTINGLKQGITNIALQIKEKEAAYRKLDDEIKELNRNVTSIQPTIDEINKTLRHYGFHSFEITPSSGEKGFYQIQRDDGTLVESTLSEGEITFITFLYFLQLTKGATNEAEITEDRILVIDDPISSLDSNVLFVVSTLIKEIIKKIKDNTGNIKQLILLTHNVYFHKEVSFIDGRTQLNNATHYWILRKHNKVTTVQHYEMNNPIKSSYDLLWQELRNREENSSVTIQNTMRRIIENYFKILGKYGDDDLIQKFETNEEQDICRSLICWINDGSHSFSDDLFVEMQDDTIERYLAVFRDIFEKTDNLGHYNMMMGIENSVS